MQQHSQVATSHGSEALLHLLPREPSQPDVNIQKEGNNATWVIEIGKNEMCLER
jgi:hypothetical protein